MGRIEVFTTSILSSIKVRKNHDIVDRALALYKDEVTRYDIASDEAQKTRWKTLNEKSTELPLVCVDGKRVGSIEQLEEALEYGEVKQFLGLDKEQKPSDQDLPELSEQEAEALLKELEP